MTASLGGRTNRPQPTFETFETVHPKLKTTAAQRLRAEIVSAVLPQDGQDSAKVASFSATDHNISRRKSTVGGSQDRSFGDLNDVSIASQNAKSPSNEKGTTYVDVSAHFGAQLAQNDAPLGIVNRRLAATRQRSASPPNVNKWKNAKYGEHARTIVDLFDYVNFSFSSKSADQEDDNQGCQFLFRLPRHAPVQLADRRRSRGGTKWIGSRRTSDACTCAAWQFEKLPRDSQSMNYRIRFSRRQLLSVLLLSTAALTTGCSPTQPFYFFEDGDLSHYVGVATNIEYPDTKTCSLQEVADPPAPFTISNAHFEDPWDLCLADAVRLALENGKVMRSLGARLFITPNTARTQITQTPEVLTQQPQGAVTVYEPALFESDPIFGPEGALSAFDAQFTSSMLWNKNDRPQNVQPSGTFDTIFPRVFEQDLGTFQSGISKTTTTGATFGFFSNTVYDRNNNPQRSSTFDWNQNFEFQFNQPLLQGAGSLYNRIAGPFNPLRGIGTYLQYDGVIIARIRTDIRLADFEAGVRNFVSDVENAYWELYFAYRNLEATKTGRNAALQTWKEVHAKYEVGAKGGEADKEAQSREQYFFFRSSLETALSDLYRAENRLRYMMGLAATDGRLIRPSDEPTDAKVAFEWCEVHAEGLARSVELRQQKWRIKQREMELIASKNLLLPRLDVTGRYRFLGLGQDLLQYPGEAYNPAANPAQTINGTDAMSTLATGDFQEWEAGLNLTIPIGFRQPLAAVRNAQLTLARERSVLQDEELEVSHQIADAMRDVDTNYTLSQTNFNRRVAAEQQVQAVQAAYEAGTVTLDLLLEAQRRRADAETAYYRSLTDYNKAIMLVHFRKGSLLEYNGVMLAEGPWPAKAYFDAKRRARARDAGLYLDYGFTRPAVFSEGPFPQFQHDGNGEHAQGMPTQAQPEEIAPPNKPSIKMTPSPNMSPSQMELPSPSFEGAGADDGGPQLMSANGSGGQSVAKFAANSSRQSGQGNTLKIAGMSDNSSPAKKDRPTDTQVRHASTTDAEAFDWGDLSLNLPANKTKAGTSSRNATATTSGTWKSSAASYETDATESATTDDRSASGWKRAQR
jgi:outer membrane protein TolC